MWEADVLVVGGGIHGCAVALELAERGRNVTVLEKSVPGAEASSAAGGILGPHLECESAGPFLDFCRHSLAVYPEWVAKLEAVSKIDLELVPCGGLLVAFDEEETGRLRERAEVLRSLDLPHEWLEGEAVRAREPGLSPHVVAGLALPAEARVEPRSIMRALAIAARAAGVEFAADTVLSMESVEAGVSVRTTRGVWSASDVVLAAGAWSSGVPGAGLPSGSVKPARGQMVLLQFPTPPIKAVVFSERGYVVPRDDGRVLCGSTLEFEGYRKEVTASGLRSILDLAIELVPAAAGAVVSESWAGFRPYTDDHLPLIGAGAYEGLWLATGHYRNGILLAPASAACLADTICGETPAVSLDAFGAGRLRG
ncbi:MAG: glycine oxidase ThiO [Deltaproteobacteria bacterium]|nr:glycine oxidase ThiO [Deltaproteobacteria bacterium]